MSDNSSPLYNDHAKLINKTIKTKESLTNGKSQYRVVLYTGFLILLYASASNSSQSLVSQIFDTIGLQSLALISLMLIFAFSALSNIISPRYLTGRKYSLAFFVTGSGYLLFILGGLLACYCEDRPANGICKLWVQYVVNIVFSIYCGIMAAAFWICENTYIAKLATPSTRGLYIGTAWALIQSSQIVGNIFAIFLLGSYSHIAYYLFLSAITIFSAALMLTLPQPQPQMTMGLDNTEIEEEEDDPYKGFTWPQIMSSVYNKIKEKKVLPCVPLMYYSGIVLSVNYGYLFKIVGSTLGDIPKSSKDEKVAQVMLALGVAEFCSGMIIGRLADKADKVKVAKLSLIFNYVSIGLALATLYTQSFLVAFFFGFAWGFSDCGNQSANTILYSEHFNGSFEIYSIYNLIQCIGTFTGFLLSLFIGDDSIVYYLAVVLFFNWVAMYGMFKYEKVLKEKNND